MEGKEDPAKKHAAVEAIGSSKKAEQRPESARYYQVWWLVFLLLFLYMYFDQYVF